MSYVKNIIFYTAALGGAAAGMTALYFGVGQDIADLLRVDSDLAKVTIDTAVGVVPMFVVGGIGEGINNLYSRMEQTDTPE